MQYTIKVALLAVTLYGTSAPALPLGKGYQKKDNTNNIEPRELDNDLSYRELNEMDLEARTNPSLEAREYFDYLEARDAAVTDAPAAPTEFSTKKAINLYEGLNLKVNALRDFTKDPKNSKNPKDPKVLSEQAFEAYLKNDTVALDSALLDPDSVYHAAAVKVAHDREVKAHFDEDPLNLDRALKNEENTFHSDAIKMALSQRDRFIAAYTDENNPLHPMAVELAAKVKKATPYKHFKVAPKKVKNAAKKGKQDKVLDIGKKIKKKAKKVKKNVKKAKASASKKLKKLKVASTSVRRVNRLDKSETATSTSSTQAPTPTSNPTPAQLLVGFPNPASSTPTSNLPATQSSVDYVRSVSNTPISNPPQAASQSSGLNSASTDSTAASPQASASYVAPTLSVAAAPVPTATATSTLKA